MYWKLVARTDSRARALADRHYSRKVKGHPEFCPPGNNIVLLGLNDDALWVSHRPDPRATLAKRFGVSQHAILKICNGKSWRHLPRPQKLF